MIDTVIVVVFIGNNEVYLKDRSISIFRCEDIKVGEGPLFNNVARSLAKSVFSNITNLYRINEIIKTLNTEYICYVAVPAIGYMNNILSFLNGKNYGRGYKRYNIGKILNDNSIHSITRGIIEDYLHNNYISISLESEYYC